MGEEGRALLMNIKIYLHTAATGDESKRYELRATEKYEGIDIDGKRQIIPERNGGEQEEKVSCRTTESARKK